MFIAFWVVFGLAVICWMLSFISCYLGHCEIGLGDEYWENERWERLYYKVFAPVGVICLFASIILLFIQVF